MIPSPAAWEEAREALGRALARFGEALARTDVAQDDLVRDGLIRRFEFTFEQFWKTLRIGLVMRGLEPAPSPRSVLSAAYAEGWLASEAPWVAMIRDRNRTSHTYREAIAREVAAQLPAYHALMAEVAERLPRLAPPAP